MLTTKVRRSLSALAGAASVAGDADAAAELRTALTVPPLPEQFSAEERALVEKSLSVHLFHSFAARTHPLTVRHLLTAVPVGPGQTVLDPFVGSGTVLVEAALLGATGVGLDIGELQVRLSRFKATPVPPAMQRALLRLAEQVTQSSLSRVAGRRRPARRWDDPRHYEPHVYLELGGLREEIEAVRAQDPPLAEALLLVFSAILIKGSRQQAESTFSQVVRSLGKGQVSRWFLYKAQEVCRLLAAYAGRLPGDPGPPAPLVVRGDARGDLHTCVAPGTVDVVVTSPPYLGVYDYSAHHARRCAWLNIDPGPAEQAEMAARRHSEELPLKEVLSRHQADSDAWVGGVAHALRAGGRAYVIVGDTVVAGTPVPGDEPIRRAADRAGLPFRASCSVERHDPLTGAGRGREHLLLFSKPAGTG